MSRALTWLLALGMLTASAQANDRFALEHARAEAAMATAGDRFSVQASAEIREPRANAPRFVMKRVLADCAPLPDALFKNSFE